METAFADALPRHLASVVAKEEGVADFLHWFNRAWWSAEASASEELSSFVARIETLIYVLVSGHGSEDEFLANLREEAVRMYGLPSDRPDARRRRVRLIPVTFGPPVPSITALS